MWLLHTGGDNYDGWTPPSEAEMKILSARRERQNKISALMGQYLLKGYKMLGTCCSLCGVRYLLKGFKMLGSIYAG